VTVPVQFYADAPKPSIGGTVTLWANDREVGNGRIDRTIFRRFSGYSAMDIGREQRPASRPQGLRRHVTVSPSPAPWRKPDFTLCPAKEEYHKAAHEVHHHMATSHGISTQPASALAQLLTRPPQAGEYRNGQYVRDHSHCPDRSQPRRVGVSYPSHAASYGTLCIPQAGELSRNIRR
jgi:hypothetical protein